MYFLTRQPWGRYLLAGAVLVLAAWIELRPTPLVDRPFAAVDIEAATPFTDDVVEWRQVAIGVLPELEPSGVAAIDIPAGSPLTTVLITDDRPQAPQGWWLMELPLAADLQPGVALQLIVIPGPGEPPVEPIPSLVVQAATSSGSFANDEAGLVAVPPDRAADAAVAAAGNRISVLAASSG